MRSQFRAWTALATVAASGFLATPTNAQTATIVAQPQSGLLDVSVQDLGTVGSFERQWGQTFRTPDAATTFLSTWSIWGGNYFAAFDSQITTLPFMLSILEWNGSSPVGPALFTSEATVPTAPISQFITFDVDQLLDPSKIYIALVSAASPGNGMSAVWHSCNVCVGEDTYAAGGLVEITSGYDPATGTYRDISDAPSITNYGAAYDMAFEANFDAPVTATPEPASMTLLATGMAGLAGYARRRKKKAQEK